jgi:hypothetical protein
MPIQTATQLKKGEPLPPDARLTMVPLVHELRMPALVHELRMPPPPKRYKAGTVKAEAIAPEGRRKYYKLCWTEPDTGATRTRYLRTADREEAECARWNQEHSMGDEIYVRRVPHRKPRGRRRGRSMAKKARPKAKGK